MANQFGGPSAQGAFWSGLGGSIARAISDDYDQRHKEEEEKKAFDIQVLTKAMNDPDITPSQARELLSRMTDIYKPKGHGGIKENLKHIFGGQSVYESQAGDIIKDVVSRPKLQVGTEAHLPMYPSIRPPNVQLPDAPSQQRVEGGPDTPVYEKTYRELDREDAALKSQDTLDRQIAMENLRDEHIRERQKLQNQASLEKFIKETGYKDRAAAEKELNKRAALYGDYTDPVNRERARVELQAEKAQNEELAKTKLDNIKDTIKDRTERRKLTEQRIQQAQSRLEQTRGKDTLKNDVNVQQADGKIKIYSQLAEDARKKAAAAYANMAASVGDTAQQWLKEAESFIAAAQKDEAEIDIVLQAKSDYLARKAGLVVLPHPPGRTGSVKKQATMLTRKEILDAGGTEDDVKAAAAAGRLAK